MSPTWTIMKLSKISPLSWGTTVNWDQNVTYCPTSNFSINSVLKYINKSVTDFKKQKHQWNK